jgi:uncharacterized protein (TIGR02217 family)
VPDATDQRLGVGDGVATRFALSKAYGDTDPQIRLITRPVPESVRVAIDGVPAISGWSLDGGTLQFVVAPAAGAVVSAGFLFDVPVRFAQDTLEVSRSTFLAGEAPSVPLVEIRE